MTELPTIAMEKVDFLPPNRVTDDASVLTLKNLVLEPMLSWQDGKIAQGLFDRFALSEDGRHWQLELRQDARFHDDTPVQAQHAKAFIEEILKARDMFGMPWSYARYLDGAEITAEGLRLSIRTPEPFADLPDILSEFYLPRPDAKGEPTLGTGPWAVESFTRGAEAVLSHRADGRRLRFVAIPRAEDRLAALQDGTVQAAMHMERLARPRRALDGFIWHEQAITLSVIAYMNGASGVFADPRARLAANLAIDRQALITQVMGGLGLPATTIVSPWHHGFGPAGLPAMGHDPTRARALLTQVEARKTITLRSPSHMPERAPEIAAFLADSLQDVGFAVTIDLAHDRPAYARELGEKRTGDLAIFDSSPHSTFRVADDKISSRTRAVWWQGVVDHKADGLFETARRTLDPQARDKAYGALLRHLHAEPHWLYLFHPVEALAHVPELRGLSLTHKGILRIA